MKFGYSRGGPTSNPSLRECAFGLVPGRCDERREHQPQRDVSSARLSPFEPLEHPDVEGPEPERRDKAGPVGVHAEPRQQRTERELSAELKARSTGVNRVEPVSVARKFLATVSSPPCGV
jgi:hypothetical protein